MISRRIMVLSAFGVVACGYFIFFKDRDDFIYPFAASLIVLMIAYVFQFQLDQLMTRGVPQRIPMPMHQLLMTTAPHFAAMPLHQQLLMEDRMKRWIIRKEFIHMNKQDAPEDVNYILAYYAILLTLHRKDFLFDRFDRIAYYHHPFLTPGHTEDAHIVEVEVNDGTLIISVPHILKGHLEQGYYNITVHAIAEMYKHQYKEPPIAWTPDIWERLEAISSISKEKIEAYLGLNLDNPWPVAVHHQLIYKHADIQEVTDRLPQFKRV